MSVDPGPNPADTKACPPSLHLPPKQARRETLPGGTVVFTSDVHRVGTDALLLADFCTPPNGWGAAASLCDLGSGCGVVLLSAIDAGFAGRAVGVEIDPAGAALLCAAARENNLPAVEAAAADLREYRAGRPFDLAVSNPPYFSAGPLPQNAVRAAARHEQSCTLPGLCAAAKRILKDRGRFCLCYPPARLADLFCALREAGLEPKRLRMVRKSAEAPPWLALVEARKGGGVQLAVLPDRILPPGQPVRY